MEGQKALGFHLKYLKLCSKDEQRSYGFGTTWGWENKKIFLAELSFYCYLYSLRHWYMNCCSQVSVIHNASSVVSLCAPLKCLGAALLSRLTAATLFRQYHNINNPLENNPLWILLIYSFVFLQTNGSLSLMHTACELTMPTYVHIAVYTE